MLTTLKTQMKHKLMQEKIGNLHVLFPIKQIKPVIKQQKEKKRFLKREKKEKQNRNLPIKKMPGFQEPSNKII